MTSVLEFYIEKIVKKNEGLMYYIMGEGMVTPALRLCHKSPSPFVPTSSVILQFCTLFYFYFLILFSF